jgi:hypothetical protein
VREQYKSDKLYIGPPNHAFEHIPYHLAPTLSLLATFSQGFMGKLKTFPVIGLHPDGMSPRPPPKVIYIKGYISNMLIIMW